MFALSGVLRISKLAETETNITIKTVPLKENVTGFKRLQLKKADWHEELQ